MKTIAISSCGIGLGHAIRDKQLFDELENKFNTKILSYGEGYPHIRKSIAGAVNVPGILYEQGTYSLKIFSDVFWKIANFAQVRRNYLHFCEALDKIKPDLIIADSEPNAFLYAHRRNIPAVVMTNVITTLNYYNALPASVRNSSLGLQRFMLKRLVQFMRKRARVFVEPSFAAEKADMAGVIYSDLFVRIKPAETNSAKTGKGFFYVSIGSQYEVELLEHLKTILPKFNDKYFVVASKTVEKKEQGKNFEILPFVENPFAYIKACSGIIAPAGHTIISEALVYKKPLLVVPMKNHIEQQVNAHLVEKQGFGAACHSLDKLEKGMRGFFAKLDSLQENVSKTNFKGSGAEQVAEIAKDILK